MYQDGSCGFDQCALGMADRVTEFVHETNKMNKENQKAREDDLLQARARLGLLADQQSTADSNKRIWKKLMTATDGTEESKFICKLPVDTRQRLAERFEQFDKHIVLKGLPAFADQATSARFGALSCCNYHVWPI